jgi:hypothetical protein
MNGLRGQPMYANEEVIDVYLLTICCIVILFSFKNIFNTFLSKSFI